MAQPIGFWDKSEWIESVRILEIVGEKSKSRLTVEKKRQLAWSNVDGLPGNQPTTHIFKYIIYYHFIHI